MSSYHHIIIGDKWEDQELITRSLERYVHMEVSERGSENVKCVELVVDQIVTVRIVQVLRGQRSYSISYR
jgi:hypothetical protein